jgi:hypothetical protein
MSYSVYCSTFNSKVELRTWMFWKGQAQARGATVRSCRFLTCCTWPFIIENLPRYENSCNKGISLRQMLVPGPSNPSINVYCLNAVGLSTHDLVSGTCLASPMSPSAASWLCVIGQLSRNARTTRICLHESRSTQEGLVSHP